MAKSSPTLTSSAFQFFSSLFPVVNTRHSCSLSFLNPQSASLAFCAYSHDNTFRSPVIGVPKHNR